ncbi:MAG TPA: hypothetical protein VGO00_15390 [Kofleriaceae bacterium]|nr:hypothetical protein [Kofleriaceae bacterium]
MTQKIVIGVAATTGAVALMLAPRIASADRHHGHCEAVSGELVEDPAGAANCPTGHPGCFTGGIDGHNLHATTLFFGEGAEAAPPSSPNWFSYSGVTTYTTHHGSFTTRETGLVNADAIPGAEPDGATASLSMEVITSGTGEYADASGYIFVNGFSDDNAHVVSEISGRICRP